MYFKRKRAAWVLLGTIIAAGLSFLFQTKLSLILSDEDFGALSSLIVVAVSVSILGAFGVQNVSLDLIKVQRASPHPVTKSFLLVWAINSLVIVIALCSYFYFFSASIWGGVFVAGYSSFLILFTVLGSVKQTQDNFLGVGAFLVAPEVVKIITVVIALLLESYSLSLFVRTSSIVSVFVLALGFYLLFAYSRGNGENGPSYFYVAKRGMPYSISGLLFMVYYRCSLLVLSMLGLHEEAGSLALIYLLLATLLLVPTAYNQKFLLGIWHSISNEDDGRFKSELRRQIVKSFYYAVPLSAFWLFLSDDLFEYVYPGRYQHAQDFAYLFSAVLLLKGLCIPLQSATSIAALKWWKTFCVALAAGFAFISSLVLIPVYGFVGTFYASLIAELSLVFSLVFVILRHFKSS